MKMRFRRTTRRPLASVVRATTPARSMLYRQVFFGVLLTLLISALFWSVWYVTRLQAFTITEVSVVGGETISHEVVRTAVEEELTGSYYRLVPKRFSYLYPEEAIEARLQRVPRLKEVAVERTSRHQVAVAFTEYVPHALWCATQDAPTCLFIDRDGFAFAEAPRLEGGAYLRYVETGREPVVGETVFSSTYVRETNAFVETLYDALRLPVEAAARDGDSITYHLAGGGEIRTTTTQALQDTLDNLQTLLASEEFSHLEPGNFVYIDLRFGSRVYVQETLPAEAATSSEAVREATAE